jgi:hypothetical protein
MARRRANRRQGNAPRRRRAAANQNNGANQHQNNAANQNQNNAGNQNQNNAAGNRRAPQPRDSRRHTRRHPAGPVWQGVDTNVTHRIADTGLRPSTHRADILWSAMVEPPRTLRPPLLRIPTQPPPPPILGPTLPPPRHLEEIFTTHPIVSTIFSYLDVDDYIHLREASRQFAMLLPHHMGINGDRHASIAALPQRCTEGLITQPRGWWYTTTAAGIPTWPWLSRDAAPRRFLNPPQLDLYRECGSVQRSRKWHDSDALSGRQDGRE